MYNNDVKKRHGSETKKPFLISSGVLREKKKPKTPK